MHETSSSDSFIAQGEDPQGVLDGRLGQPFLAGPGRVASERSLDFGVSVDRLFVGSDAEDLRIFVVLFPANWESSARFLVLDGRFPPSIEREDPVGGGQVQARPA